MDFINILDIETLHYYGSNLLQILNANLQNLIEIINQSNTFWESQIFGVLIGAIIAWGSQWYFANRKEKQEKENEERRQCNVLKAAIAALEETRYSVLIFKSQFSKPYDKELQIIEEKTKNKNESTIINVWKEKTPKSSQTFSPISFNGFLYGKELDFLNLKRTPYLVVFHKLIAELNTINHLIKQRNKFTEFYVKEIFSDEKETIHQIKIAYGLHESAAKGLENLTDSILAFIVLCKDYIEEYSKSFLTNYKIPNFTLELETELKNLMPSSDYHKNLDNMIQKAIKEE